MDTKNVLPTIIVIVIIMVIATAIVMWWPNAGEDDLSIAPTSIATPVTTVDETPLNTPAPTAGNENITIERPTRNSAVGLPFIVEGQARVFENTLQVRLRDANREVLVERTVMANAPDAGQFGPYRVELYYPEPAGDSGVVEVFQYSARDGSEIDRVNIPVRFEEVESQEVEVYFSNSEIDPDMENCAETYALTRRIPETVTVGRSSLEQLLLGPTNDEREEGFFTSIPAGVQVNSLTIEDGTATVDFNEALREDVGGSCLVQAILSQINNTLTQFSTVDDIVVSINGDTEDVLQP